MALTVATTATAAGNSSNCRDVVEHCNQLLREAGDIREEQRRIIELQKEELTLVTQNLQIANKAWEEEKRRANAWYKDPFVVIPTALVIGFIGGIAMKRP
jgi:hypothetical protein